jgi:predicted transposase/invertase (TIGR01784 family)
LCSFVNAVLGWTGERALVKLSALPTKAKGDNAKDKEAEFDVYAVDGLGRRYEVEIQLREQGFYANRALYYWAKMYAFQLDKSKDYMDLAPCLGIHLMNWRMWDGPRRHHRFELREADTHERLTDHLGLHML